jgi:hypothetical protein
MCFAGFPIIFQERRGWSAGVGDLAFLGVFVGMMAGIIYVRYDNKRYVRIYRETGGYAPPECRLPPAILGGGLIVVGLALFAATNGPGVFWLVPIMAGAPFAMSFVLVLLASANYLYDIPFWYGKSSPLKISFRREAYVIYAASLLAAYSAIRSLFGVVFPLFTTYMYQVRERTRASMV